MAFPCCNFRGVLDFNKSINVGHEDGMCDSTYLGHFEIPVELPDEDDRFFGTHIRGVVRTFKNWIRAKNA